MTDANTRLITCIKLAELQRQRDRLTRHYAGVEERARAAGSPLERLRVLYDGLREARFAQKPLHPGASNLDILFFEAASGKASPELIQDWITHLERELVRGRLRTEFAHAFGQTLDEWANPPPATGPTQAEPGEEEPWDVLCDATPIATDLNILGEVFRNNAAAFDAVRAEVRAYGESAMAPASTDEVKALLNMLAGDVYRDATLRRQAVAARSSDTQINEYAGVLTVLLNNLDDWDWPAEGIDARSLWKRGKWRPYLDEDLIALLFLELIGLRWGMKLKVVCQVSLLHNVQVFRVPGWTSPEDQVMRQRLGRAETLLLTMIPFHLNALVGTDGYRGSGGGGYGGQRARTPEMPNAMDQLLTAVVGEIRYHQATAGTAPLYVVQTDLRDYYPSIPHDVLLALVEQLGFPAAWQTFFRKYLAVPLRTQRGPRRVYRGIVLGHLIGAVLADVLLLLDIRVFQEHKVRLHRLVDDIYLIADAEAKTLKCWHTIVQFCKAAGLKINERKSGSVCLGGALPEGLPEGAPQWGLLRLQKDATWALDEPALERLEDQLRRQLHAAPTVLGMVALYNEYLAFVQKSLGLCVRLDDGHLDRVGRRLAGLHQGLFGEGHGLIEEVRRRLRRLFLDARLQKEGLPEALLYWPITAGGLGLTHPLVAVRGFQNGQAPMPAPINYQVNVEWLGASSHLPQVYNQSFLQNRLLGPSATPALEALVNDFIARGGEVGGRKQVGLSAYWQWVVYTYGPPLLESLGTFRFLLTELVPLQLILENRIEATTLGGDAGTAATP